MESSPVSRTHFDDITWSAEGKRRRTDTMEDEVHRPTNAPEYSNTNFDSRRTSVVESMSGPVQQPNYPPSASHHHRPSLPFSGPPPAVMRGHVRHHSTSGIHQAVQYPHHQRPSVTAAASYHQQRPSVAAAVSYHQPAQHHEYGVGYYPEPHNAYRAQDPYFGQPHYANVAPLGYEGAVAYHHQPAQYSYTFQSTMSGDQNSFQHRKRRGNLPKEATAILKEWFSKHSESPYPTEDEKLELCRLTGLTLNQVSSMAPSPCSRLWLCHRELSAVKSRCLVSAFFGSCTAMFVFIE